MRCSAYGSKPVAPHREASPSLVLPVVIHQIHPVVAVARARRIGQVAALTPDDPHRKTIQAIVKESPVPQTEGLIRNLTYGSGVPASVPGVDLGGRRIIKKKKKKTKKIVNSR